MLGLPAGIAVALSVALRWHEPAATVEVPPNKPPPPSSDWPMYRHDPALTAVSPLRGGLAEAPQPAWSLDLGGPKVPAERVVVRDVTGDGQDEFLTLSADTVTCRDSRGRVLWTLPHFLSANVVDVRDFVGDGSRGILLTTFLAGKTDTYMVGGRTGKATHLWRDENNFGGQTRIGQLLPGVPGVQIAAAASGATPPAPQGGPVRLVSFEEGLDRPHFRVRHHVTGVFYSPLILLDDLDGDGTAEMVVISHEQIWAFDPRSGKQSFHAAYAPSIRTYSATIAAIKLQPQDACPALVMINPHLPGLRAVRQDGKTFARELWKVVIGGKEDQYQKNVTIAPAGPGLVHDLENDGRFQILASIKNEHGDGKRHLVVFEARTGKRLAEMSDAEVLAVDDLDGDGKPEVLFRRDKELHIARWKVQGFHSVYQGPDVLPVLRPPPSEGDLRLASPGGLPSRSNRTVWREKADSPRFLLRFPDGVHSCRLGSAGLEKGEMLTHHEALGNLSTAPSPPEQLVWDGSKLVALRDGREVYRYVPPAPTTYLAPPPLVVDLAGKRRILVRDSAGNYLLVSEAGQKDRVVLERPYETPHILVDAAGVGPMVCDMDGDGDNDIVATVTDARGRPACVVLDGHGKEKRRFELLPGMTALSRGPTGRLGPGRGRWLLLRMSGEGSGHQQRQVVVAFDGRSGKQLWVRDHYGHYGKNPVVFVPHFPSAVLDYDGDDADDWVVCSENFYGILSVKDNKDLVGPVVLSDALPGHWTAYTFPSLASPHGDTPPVVFHHNAYAMALVTDLAGKPLWHFGMTRDTAGTWGQFVDIDGDGEREVLHAQPDGLLRCFSFSSSGRCPTCPADAPPAKNKESRPRWQLDLGRPISRMIAADLQGDGRMALLFGGADGKLHALGEQEGKPRLLWSVSLGRRVGEPVLTDLDGDGRPAILVTTEDGRLYCLKGNRKSE
ncbi:MAG TPA: hypothetical protein VH643_21050 [Gemmataceae bacterium]|jgi:hypothetical protein